jgi:hypothetical protein
MGAIHVLTRASAVLADIAHRAGIAVVAGIFVPGTRILFAGIGGLVAYPDIAVITHVAAIHQFARGTYSRRAGITHCTVQPIITTRTKRRIRRLTLL